MIGVNMGSKGHVNRVKGTVKIRIQNLRFYNSDIFTIAQCAINLQLYGYLHNAYNKLFFTKSIRNCNLNKVLYELL